ncbi:zinc-dependent alcohol dehydrogenase family protein [Flavobacteriaceae bacterium S0825]|uniref:zinc-dependent alcohol dehydrogenase family protein n=1 Tax=Gaetbulibacter sp. S0825 TaxID=2720084 RepID=UPI00143215EE|nr:zinc-dependent alcohol dehydrogenase family protein [Gaetbulibacter sp. S0825]MCK0108737.1 zinc-dependent alcohol dehydrogenase family protein [Flavobacteriaceae bacterium S0825]NIX64373.1 zinc-dependent alcohol dehydrogenase family protein [Gaetbulibacter sp. S0825]
MRAVVYEKFQGPITIQNIPDPTPKSDGVVVKVNATGLCRSDWHGWMGHDQDIVLPHVPGHELAGTIVEVGNGIKNFNIGDRVTIPFVAGCGNCGECKSGNQQVCDYQSQPGFTHHGSFAEYVALDYADTNLVRLPEEINNVTAATLGCRFITAFRAIVEQGKVSEGQHVAIHGCGGVGLSAIMIANALGAQVTAIDINDETLELAKQLGAQSIINATSNNVVEAIREITKGGAHVSMDALGSEKTCLNSIASLKKRGKHIQVGLMTENHKHPNIPMDRILADELEIIGSHGMQAYRYPEMLKMIVDGKLYPEKLIEKTITLEEAIVALPNMNKFKNKGMLVINSF